VETNLRTLFQEDWMALLIVGSMMLLSWSKYLYPQLYSQFKYVLVNQKYQLSFHKGKMLTHPFSLMMSISAWIHLSLFAYILIPEVTPDLERYFELSFIHIAIYTAVFLLIKTWTQILLADVFENQLIKRLLFSKMSLLSFNSWILTLSSILLIYLSNHNLIIIYSAISVFLLLYTIGYINALRNHKNQLFKQFMYFILYLCTLEIAPILIIINYLKIA
jgi:hypothetical protein